jgi:hypothetical protein
MRITNKMLDILADRINKLAGTPMTYMNKETREINIGHYHLDCAYGGYKLVQTDNNGGGIHTISESGYTTKRNLYNEMRMFIAGLEAKQ